jgi:hypothetical protein
MELDHLFYTPEILQYHGKDSFRRIVSPRLNIFTNIRFDGLGKHSEGIYILF